jgi:hypothetical protein
MKNKAKFQASKINISSAITKDYEYEPSSYPTNTNPPSVIYSAFSTAQKNLGPIMQKNRIIKQYISIYAYTNIPLQNPESRILECPLLWFSYRGPIFLTDSSDPEHRTHNSKPCPERSRMDPTQNSKLKISPSPFHQPAPKVSSCATANPGPPKCNFLQLFTVFSNVCRRLVQLFATFWNFFESFAIYC